MDSRSQIPRKNSRPEKASKRRKTNLQERQRGATGRKSPKRAPVGYDGFLLASTLLLLGTGLVMVYSASSVIALDRFGCDAYFFKRQMVYALCAILTLMLCRHVPYPLYRKSAYPLLGAALLLLIAVFLPGVGHAVGGAKRWIRVFGVSFQPSEFAKLALIIYLAYSMNKKQDKLKMFSIGILPHAIVFGCFGVILLMQPDFGMAAMLGLKTALDTIRSTPSARVLGRCEPGAQCASRRVITPRRWKSHARWKSG